MKRQTSVHIEEATLLAFQVACKRRRYVLSEEVERLMYTQLEDWDEPTRIDPMTTGRIPARKG